MNKGIICHLMLLRLGGHVIPPIWHCPRMLTFGGHNVAIKRCIAASRVALGLYEFFENGLSLPVFDPANRKTYGRAWAADELRRKSFADLHKLWFVLLKELNLLSTQRAEAARVGQRWFGTHRMYKCRLSMARIKTILTERQVLYEHSIGLTGTSNPSSEGEIVAEIQKRDKMRQLWRKRHFRQRMNYRSRRLPLFT